MLSCVSGREEVVGRFGVHDSWPVNRELAGQRPDTAHTPTAGHNAHPDHHDKVPRRISHHCEQMPEPVHQPGTAAAASASSRSATQMHAQSQPAAFSAGSVLSLPRIAIDLPRRLGDLLQSGDLEMKAAHPDGPTSSTTSGAGSIRSPHQWTLHVEESLEDDQASFTADLLSPCTLGVAIPADSGESAFLASSCAPTNATSGVGQVLPAIAASSDVKRIDGETMARLLQGAYKGQGEHQVEQFVVIDCRYDYEYAGGHSQ
jgi:hypothetical protein